MKIFNLEQFTFHAKSFVEYSGGRIINQGLCNITVRAKSINGLIRVDLLSSEIRNKIYSHFDFDLIVSFEDRLQMVIVPDKTNVKSPLFNLLKHVFQCTRSEKNFSPLEPIAGSIFTNHGKIMKLGFSFENPERLIEFSDR